MGILLPFPRASLDIRSRARVSNKITQRLVVKTTMLSLSIFTPHDPAIRRTSADMHARQGFRGYTAHKGAIVLNS